MTARTARTNRPERDASTNHAPRPESRSQSRSQPAPLFPLPIEVLGLGGEYASGKTLFGLTICPGAETLYLDFEKSGATYASLGATRVDVPKEMLREYPSGNYKPLDVFNWWRAYMRSIEPGKYRVIICDTANDLEQGLADYVAKNPREFGRTPNQYYKMAGLMWGDVKALLKQIMADIASRCECFVFTTHMGNVWKNDKPTRERRVKGKETFMELASLYLIMQRLPREDGTVPAEPAAIVLKSRLAAISVDSKTGKVTTRPCLPPRMPVATPFALKAYIEHPADAENLKPEERLRPEKLSDDERLLLQTQRAEAERDREMYKTARVGESDGSTGPRTKKKVRDRERDDEGSEGSPDREQNHPRGKFERDIEPRAVKDAEPDAEPDDDERSTNEDMIQATEDALDNPPRVPGNYSDHDLDLNASEYPDVIDRIEKVCQDFYSAGLGDEQTILRGIRRRDPDAASIGELSLEQALDLEASILDKIRPAKVADDSTAGESDADAGEPERETAERRVKRRK